MLAVIFYKRSIPCTMIYIYIGIFYRSCFCDKCLLSLCFLRSLLLYTYSRNDITYWEKYAVLHEIYFDKLLFTITILNNLYLLTYFHILLTLHPY